MATPAYFGMSDEEFLKQAMPVEADPVVADPVVADTTDDVVVVADATGSTEVVDPALAESKDAELDDLGEPLVEGTTKPAKAAEVVDPTTGKVPEVKADAVVDPAAVVAAKETPEKVVAEPVTPPDYEGHYKRIMAPFKANGKTIELKTPEEAIQLMQMGANYTRKMQDIVPHRKALMMLETNGLLDEGKLAYLIDLDKKNPEAIKKLIKESGIDPLEIDTTVAPNYREGNHRVTDEEANFHTALNDMKSTQTGMETLQSINSTWDHASKDLLMKSPEVMQIIQQQRESGIYDRIVAEMSRQKTFGAIAPTTPFLQAYKTVGDQLVQANAFADIVQKATPTSTVVTTRVAAAKPVVANSAAARAASSTRTSAQTQKAFVNPLAMSDDAFLKQMQNRI